MNKATAKVIMCRYFNCDRRHGHFCCSQCPHIEKCRNPCINSPLRCGLAKEVEKNENQKNHKSV